MTGSLDVPHKGLWIEIRHNLQPRLSEWHIAALTGGFGVVLLLPQNVFTGPSWVFFRAIMPIWGWAALMLLLGIARLVGLIINGRRQVITGWMRMLAAGTGFLLFLGASLAFAFSGVIGLGFLTCVLAMVVEIFNFTRSGHDIGAKHVDPTR